MNMNMDDEAVELLRALIRIDTTNPPGHERAAAELVAESLRQDKVEPQILESAPQRANLIARLRSQERSVLPPLMLTAHSDVVPAEASRWKHPPFSAALDDGWIYGRGAIDMKNMVAMSTCVVKALSREGAKLRRDVILCVVADEEAGCTLGSRWLVDEHPDLVRAEFALGELGGFTQVLGTARLYPIQVAHKGVVWMRARVNGLPAHGSVPREDNAVVRLGAALAKLVPGALPIHETVSARGFIEALAKCQPGLVRVLLPQLFRPALSQAVLGRIPDKGVARVLSAILRNTVSPTMLHGGTATNVIPSYAEATLDCRVLPGQTHDAFLGELQALLGPEVELEVMQTLPSAEAPADTPLFSVLKEAVRKMDPEGVAVPYLVPGFTDAGSFSVLGTKCYGFSPTRFPAAPKVTFSELYHGDNERIPVDGFLAGLHALYDAINRWCVA